MINNDGINIVNNCESEGMGRRREKVKIFTARLTHGKDAIHYIYQWLVKLGLPELEVTNVTDFNMVELWDDRCVSVTTNTGIT